MIEAPRWSPPGRDDTKFTRGMAVVVGGDMPGAARLAARAAMRAGAGYVMLASADIWRPGLPDALVQRAVGDADALGRLLEDTRVGAVLIGPGLGRTPLAMAMLESALAADRPLVIDGDALSLLGADAAQKLRRRAVATLLTPHGGEFERMFGKGDGDGGSGDKRARTVAAAVASGAVIVHKGADTVIASPVASAVAGDAPSWLATAGTGDVLAGLVVGRLAAHGDGFVAAREAVWLHGHAARLAGPAMIADDLIDRLQEAVAACLTN